MMGLLWDVANIAGGPQVGVEVDHAEDKIVIANAQDVEPILELNKKLFNDGTGGYGPTREWRRAASIPNIILQKWLVEDGIRWWDSEDTHKLMAKLDAPEWRHLRTAPGRLSRRPVRSFCRASTA